MRVIFKPGLMILSTETDAEADALAAWSAGRGDHVFHLPKVGDRGLALHDLGPRVEACAEPINVLHDGDPAWRPISNLARTPFDLDGRRYASVEGFWQGLKFPSADDRERIARLSGPEAKAAGRAAPPLDLIQYDGRDYPVGRHPHWTLMARACRAKFEQDPSARDALLRTGDRPLTHRVRRDSQTLPGVIMADIWMRIRRRLRSGADPAVTEP